jgi:hypothetical protein
VAVRLFSRGDQRTAPQFPAARFPATRFPATRFSATRSSSDHCRHFPTLFLEHPSYLYFFISANLSLFMQTYPYFCIPIPISAMLS